MLKIFTSPPQLIYYSVATVLYRYFKIAYGVLVELLNNFEELFDASLKFAFGTQDPLASLCSLCGYTQ